jgi:CBS-domain-containing membrane protein
MKADAIEALRKYGETLDIRRGSIQSLFPGSGEVQVSRVRLIYEGGKLMPKDVDLLNRAVDAIESAVPGVEVVFQ